VKGASICAIHAGEIVPTTLIAAEGVSVALEERLLVYLILLSVSSTTSMEGRGVKRSKKRE
jgi:hypothetical protein